MRRREFIGVFGSTLAWPFALQAQHAIKSYRVAYLALVADQDAPIVRQRLRELGYHEGGNLAFEVRSAEGNLERLSELAAEFVKTNPDVIVAGFGTATARAAQNATRSIPIIFTGAGDPLGTGLVGSLSRPGANITGIHTQAGEINGKRLQLLNEIASQTRDIAVLVNPDAPFTPGALNDMRSAAAARGQRLHICSVRAPDQLEPSLIEAVKAGAAALTILETPSLLDLRREIVDQAAKLQLVAIYGNRDFVDVGGLMSYGTDRPQLYRRAAELVDKVLKGEKPSDIPVEQPTKFELVINLRTAKALGIIVPPNLLALADEVIE